MNCNIVKVCYEELIKVRSELENKYGHETMQIMGKCIEGTDRLVHTLRNKGLKARPYQVWVLYEYYENCLEQCYEEHWLAVVEHNGYRIYLDPTFNQFQWAICTKVMPKVYIGATLPNWFLNRKPGRDTLKKCGWHDYYNGYNFENKFDYWGYMKNPHNREILSMVNKIKIK